jgi:hypothetical protein
LGGVIALIAALGGLVVLLSAFDLTDKRAALGMPEGSIRAVIALMLILPFSIMGIYIFATIRFSDANVLNLANTNEQAAEALRASDDLARQLLTTVGTSLHLPRSISGRILSRRSQVLRQPPLEASR